ncbi:MAG: hypothetical protein CR975_03925 [Gammaproteobacteria bacterium]|nr:MAG: hypothetical protein CR975_03925 [Gammaproteobacteria bacterium]
MKKQLVILGLSAFLAVSANGQKRLEDLNFGPKKETSGKALDTIVAVVGNDIITRREISRFAKKDRPAALQNLIMRKLLLQAAKRYNISVGDTAINVAAEGQSGKVSRQAVRDKLIIKKLQQRVASNYVQVSDMEVQDIVNRQLQQSSDTVKLVDILVSVPKSADPKALNQAQAVMREVRQKLDKQSGQSVAAQYPNVEYNDLGWVKLSQIPTDFSRVLSGAALNKYCPPVVDRDGIHLLKILARKGSKVTTIPEAKVAHILIRDQDNPQAEKSINRLYRQLKQGANFSTLAGQYSQDPGSAANGGDLGWVRPGQMVPAFEQVMLKTPIGKISQPFKSRFGYHILKVEQRRKTPVNNRQLLESQAKQAIFARKAAEEWDLWLARLREESHVEIRAKQL